MMLAPIFAPNFTLASPLTIGLMRLKDADDLLRTPVLVVVEHLLLLVIHLQHSGEQFSILWLQPFRVSAVEVSTIRFRYS